MPVMLIGLLFFRSIIFIFVPDFILRNRIKKQKLDVLMSDRDTVAARLIQQFALHVNPVSNRI